MEWIEKTAFEVLGIDPNPSENLSTETIEVGTYQPSDCPYLVYEIATAVIKKLEEKRQLIRQYAPSQSSRLPYVKTPEHFFTEDDKKKNHHFTLPTDAGSVSAYLDHLAQSFPDLSGFFFTRLAFRIPEEARKKHTYILGGSGSGKSELLKVLMYPYIRQQPRRSTVILFDPHGDIAEQVGRWKEHKNGDTLIFFDPTLRRGFMPCINPLEMPPNTPPEMVENMAECLTAVFKEIVGQESNITANMGTLLKAMIAVLLQRPDSTLQDLQRFVDDEQNEDLVQYAVQNSPKGKRDLFESGFYRKSYSPTKQALYTKLQDLFNSQTFYDLTVGKSTLNLKEIMDSRKTVIFSLSKGKIGEQTSSAFGRFLLAQIQGLSFQRQEIPEKDRVPTHVFLDEFHNFVTPSIEDILAESRKYAVHLTLVQQFFGQKTDTQLRAGIMNNTAVKICGTGEDTSLEKMARVMTGASKEDLQNCDRGIFYVKVKKQGGIIQQAFGTQYARPLRNNISLLGFRNGMGKDHWRAVKADQLKTYYRPLKPSASLSEADMFTPSTDTQNPEKTEKITLLGRLKGKGKKLLEEAMQEQKTPDWFAEYITEPEEVKPTPQNPPESKKRPPVILEHQNIKNPLTRQINAPEKPTPKKEPGTPFSLERRKIKTLLHWDAEAPAKPKKEKNALPAPEKPEPIPEEKPKRKPKLSL